MIFIPFVIDLVFIFGAFMVFQYFVPHESSEWVYEFLLDWITIIGIFALALGIYSLYNVSVDKIRGKKENWQYSYVTLIGLFVMVVFGFSAPVGESWGMYPLFVMMLVAALMLLIQATIASNKVLWLGLFAVSMVASVLIALFDNTWTINFSRLDLFHRLQSYYRWKSDTSLG